ncbi:NADH:ubiquinone reductase (Na(+)-transporting) subunit F [Histidinibacterium aquaticum]|uniref:Na(+)-translocating NADH-quinone reductase subunit F n=1 Tax=Histidinibacterium aquaticum TaxID=2613962 RepID=A0A5J5GML2_9RHOB|nr:NADH:ubiquinone reductase (Na(+)-transporting) subunit F [Histidinibacterium aquaticum]KAA9009415.1 NADH:ubiquinone reductase (Na(+)-transporting) subunit F [Histidinibacterium aquaticum]
MIEIFLATLLMVVLILALALIVLTARNVLQPARPVTVRVNGRTEIEGVTGQKLLDFLKVGGIPMPSGCAGAGTCGLCRAEVEGAGPPLPTETSLLGRAAIAEGERLTCQVMVRGPLSVRVPEDILSAETFECEVVSNRALAPLIKELVLKVPETTSFNFTAGEFAQLTAPAYTLDFAEIDAGDHAAAWEKRGLRKLSARSGETVTRAYSIANRPEDEGLLVFNIRLALPPPHRPELPPGVVSSYLFGLEQGDRLEVAGPYGTFRVRDSDREIVLIGGGVGMAPLRAIAHDQLSRNPERRLSYWYGARSLEDLFYDEEFRALDKAHDTFSWTVALSDPAPDDKWTGETGFIHEVVLEKYLSTHPAPENCDYYLCGPPLMMRAVTAMLDDLGVEPETVFFDDFAS